MTPVLSARDIRVSFGGVQAVRGIDLDIDRGELLGVIGPNGCGKTTLLNAICGVVAATGAVVVDGVDIGTGDPTVSARAGIARLYQAPQPFAGLTVLDNVIIGVPDRRLRGVFAAVARRRAQVLAEKHRWQRAGEALALVGLSSLADEPVERLTYGQRRLVDLARAIAAAPLVLVLDEPTAGLNDAESAGFIEILDAVRARFDPAVVLVDHKVDVIDSQSDRVLVIDSGEVVLVAPPAEVWSHPHVRRAYLGVDEEVDDARGQ